MATVQENILEGFLRKLGSTESIDEDLVKALDALFRASGKLKAEALVAAYETATKERTV